MYIKFISIDFLCNQKMHSTFTFKVQLYLCLNAHSFVLWLDLHYRIRVIGMLLKNGFWCKYEKCSLQNQDGVYNKTGLNVQCINDGRNADVWNENDIVKINSKF